MTEFISGPGIGLPLNQNLYPSELYNAPYDFPGNELALAAGDTLPIPAGRWWVTFGNFSFFQFLDPETQIWRDFNPIHGQPQIVLSDGFTRRVANLLGLPIAAVVANGGTSFSSASCTITANMGGSTWQPIVGGSLGLQSITAAGASYTVPPLVLIPPPAQPGIQATAYAVLSSNTVSGITFNNVGGGYTSAPSITLLPSPTDPNFAYITQATALVSLTNSGVITGALCTNNGGALASLAGLTLTASGGAGSGAVITPVILQTVTQASIANGGWNLGTTTDAALITSVGGRPASVSAIGNPSVELTGFQPRPYIGQGVILANGSLSSITTYDSGQFVGTPTPVVVAGGSSLGAVTMATVLFTMGSTFDSIKIQTI